MSYQPKNAADPIKTGDTPAVRMMSKLNPEVSSRLKSSIRTGVMFGAVSIANLAGLGAATGLMVPLALGAMVVTGVMAIKAFKKAFDITNEVSSDTPSAPSPAKAAPPVWRDVRSMKP